MSLTVRPTPDKEKHMQRARSAITGRFVSLWYALRHPRTTVIELVRKVKS